MREESQLDEMRAAIRGDFERLAERRGEQELLHVTEHEAPSESDRPVLPDSPEPEPRRSWFARFVAH